MAIAPAAVSAAYQAASRIASPDVAGAASESVSGQGFGSMLQEAMSGAMGSLKSGEAAAAQGMAGSTAGSGDVVNVVNAVTNAELTLQTVVAIRDKVIAAYQNIMQMPI
jgi:flagellar hook-basal body complex protein FliE